MNVVTSEAEIDATQVVMKRYLVLHRRTKQALTRARPGDEASAEACLPRHTLS